MESTGHISICLRYDDVSARSNLSFEERLTELLIADQIPMIFGVIPYVCDGDWRDPQPQAYRELTPEKCALLKNAMLNAPVEVSMHGLTHQNVGNTSKSSEFVGLPLAEQQSKVEHGVRLLEQALCIRPTIFVPPWNRFDQNTIQALINCDFSIVSASRSNKAPANPAIRQIPTTVIPKNMLAAVAEARKSSSSHALIVVELHEYDFVEVGGSRGVASLQSFRDDLTLLRSDPLIRLSNFKEFIAECDSAGQPTTYFPTQPLLSFERLKALIRRFRRR